LPPITWYFAPEQSNNPDKLRHHLILPCLAYPSENQQLLALAYQATVQDSQRTVAETGTQTASEDKMVEAETQTTTTTVVTPVVRKETVDKENNGSISLISKRGRRKQKV